MLLKPDMGHIETWPNIYLPNETYMPFKWDMSDLKEKIGYFLDNPKTIAEYAKKAQEKFDEYRNGEKARYDFCTLVKQIVE